MEEKDINIEEEENLNTENAETPEVSETSEVPEDKDPLDTALDEIASLKDKYLR